MSDIYKPFAENYSYNFSTFTESFTESVTLFSVFFFNPMRKLIDFLEKIGKFFNYPYF